MNKPSFSDRVFMRRCLELAARGKGFVSPNPMVGCVIVKNGKIVSEGYHQRFGGAHAEILALRKAGRKARGATVYVNLEPCAHHGKTPPCVDALVRAGVRRVVAASWDPNPLVSGKGFAKMRRAGLQVRVGVLRPEAELLNERFYTFMRTGMPFIGMKIAQTLDGYIADHRGRSKWITSEQAREEAHRIRAEYDAILVGANTVIEDNPRLTVRAAKGRNPVRIVLDGQLRVPAHARIFSTRLARTILFTTQRALLRKRSTVSRLTERGVQVLALESARGMDEHAILRSLGALGISSILVEGGSTTASGFLQKKLVKRLHCFVAPKITGGGLHAVVLKPALELPKAIQMSADGIRLIGSDLLVEGRLVYS